MEYLTRLHFGPKSFASVESAAFVDLPALKELVVGAESCPQLRALLVRDVKSVRFEDGKTPFPTVQHFVGSEEAMNQFHIAGVDVQNVSMNKEASKSMASGSQPVFWSENDFFDDRPLPSEWI